MTLNGGDSLARGAHSAKFSTQAGLSDFEHDLIFYPDTVAAKYGLTEVEIEQYQKDRTAGVQMPDLPTKAIIDERVAEESDPGFTVTDRRSSHLLLDSEPVPQKTLKFAKRTYTPFKPILDRILVKRVSTDENMELLEDGSMRDKRSGFVIPAKYRQHQNTGIVLATGDFVIVGGVKSSMEDILQPGCLVWFGEYNAEKIILPAEKVQEMCDAVQCNNVLEEELNLVRVQDVRGVEWPEEAVAEEVKEHWFIRAFKWLLEIN